MLTFDWLRDFKHQGIGRKVRRGAKLSKRATHVDRAEFSGLRSVELLEDRALLSWVTSGPTSVTNGQVENITNRPVSGAIHTVAAHPTNADVLFLGSVNGGIWKTTNATAASPSWTAQSDDQESLSIGTIEFDPTDGSSNTLVAGMARYSSLSRIGGPRAGLLRTTNSGTSWSALDGGGVLDGKNINGLAARGSTIVISVDIADSFTYSNIGIFRSTNTGASFSQLGSGQGIPRGVNWDLASDPSNNAVLYTAVTSAESGASGNRI